MLRERILKQLEKEGVGQRKLAQVANVNESTISRYLNGFDELKFESLLKIVKYLFPEQEKEYIAEYALTQKNQNARYCMEYCTINGLYDVAKQLVDKLSTSTNPTDREWAKVYYIEVTRLTEQVGHEELLEELKRFYPNSLEVQIMHTFVVAYIYYDINKHHLLYEYLDNVEKLIENVKSVFLRDCYFIRLGLFMHFIYLYQNKVEQARKYSFKIIDRGVSDHINAKGYLVLGNTYIFEDYKKALKYLDEALILFKKANREKYVNDVVKTIVFLNSYWKIDYDYPLEIETEVDKADYAYYLLQKGEDLQALEILRNIDIGLIPEWEKGFYYYYRGLAEKDTDLLYHSVKWFKITENLFFIQLPIQALQESNEKEVLLEIFSL